jgi:hypothetical protein
MELNDMIDWQSERRFRDQRLDAGSKFAEGKMVALEVARICPDAA